MVPSLYEFLKNFARSEPFNGAPGWSPFLHAGTWLFIAAILTGVLKGHTKAFRSELSSAWKTGRLAVLTIMTFSVMAELLSGSGIANGLAMGLFEGFGRGAIFLTPLISAAYGALANSGNAANGLFMASQVGLASKAGFSLEYTLALQHVAALSLNMVSPVRISIACNLAGVRGYERDVYKTMLPFIIAVIATLLACSGLIAGRIL